MGERNLDFSHETHANFDCLLRHNFTLWLNWCKHSFATFIFVTWIWLPRVLGPQLDYLILEHGITNFVASHLSESVNSCYVGVLNSEVDLNMTAILLL